MRGILLILALFGAFGLVGNIDYAAQLEQEAAEKLARPARAQMTLERYAALLAGCLNNGALSWIDPVTEKEMLTVCDSHEAPIAGKPIDQPRGEPQ